MSKIKELHQKIQSGQEKSEEITKMFLANAKGKNDSINAFLDIYEQEALKKAQEVDEKVKKGEEIDLLAGIPCGIKDNICMKGKEISAASKMLEHYKAPYNATVVDKLNKKDVVVLGKTNMDEFAMGSSTENSAFGVTKNPFDETRVAGGTSGGSTAAVAAKMTPWALGSDTGGSVRQPAGFCGVIGFKPTYGRVSRYGLMPYASSFDQISPTAHHMTDIAIALDAICGQDKKDDTSAKKEKTDFYKNLNPSTEKRKIGIIKECFGLGLDDKVRKKIEEKIQEAKDKGAQIEEVSLPSFEFGIPAYYLMVSSETSSNMARIDAIRYGLSDTKKSKSLLDVYGYSREEGFGDEVKRKIMLGTHALSAGHYDAYYQKAQKVRNLVKKELRDIFSKVDALICPTSPAPAFKIGANTADPLQMYLVDVYTVIANLAMIPAVSIPVGTVEEEGKLLPVGMQLLGKWWDEQTLLDIGAALGKNNE